MSISSDNSNSDDSDDGSDADSDSSGDVSSGEDNTEDPPNMLSPDEHFSRDNPRPLWVRFASGPNGQTARSHYPHEVVWTDADSILKLNKWRRDKERRANKIWGNEFINRHVMVDYAADHTQ